MQIAVIVANRNNARYLPECLESVFRQTLRPAEIIVVDDASTDDSRQLLSAYAQDGRVKVLFNDRQLGVAASRHRGITHSNSPFLTTLDADDYYYGPDKLARECAAIGDAPDSHRVAFSDVLRIQASGEPIGLVSGWRRLRQGNLCFHIRHLNGFIPRDYLVSRADYFAAGGFDPTFAIYEDWDLKVRLSKRCTWHYSGTVGTAYRDNPQGLSRTPRREHVAAMRRVFWSNCPQTGRLARAVAFARFFFYHSLYLGRPAL